MAVFGGPQTTGQAFRQECLVDGRSLLWPTDDPWVATNLSALDVAFLGNPIEGTDLTFLEKLDIQLRDTPEGVRQVAADLLLVYYLFPANISPATKLAHIKRAAGDDLAHRMPTEAEIWPALVGAGAAGTAYSTYIFWGYQYLLRFCVTLRERRVDPLDQAAVAGLADELAENMSGHGVHGVRNALLHLFFPDMFEAIASSRDKERIVKGFHDRAAVYHSIDEALLNIRSSLEAERGERINFYAPDIRAAWQTGIGVVGDETAAGSSVVDIDSGPKIWIEKTLVRGRSDRQAGARALGKALWSPRAARGGGDAYRFMRDVREGDIVLHLIDNEAFAGMSVAAGEFREGQGLPDTAWPGPAYTVDLRNYTPLQPPLPRHDFFEGPARQALQQLVDAGTKNLFYNKALALNQGAYLTPVPQKLAAALNLAYQAIAGKDLFEGISETETEAPLDRQELVHRFTKHVADSALTFGVDGSNVLRSFLASIFTKPFVILTGLSGSGKTQLAIKFGDWLGEDHYLVEAVRPDWTGSEALFGYEDALKPASSDGRRAWTVPRALELMLKAYRDPGRPYLLILDEMNLAHVERYFADFLSGSESNEAVLPNLIREADGEYRVPAAGAQRVRIPSNVIVVGTVNVDETTYMFSPKVLDRANTFEFRVTTQDLRMLTTKPGRVPSGGEHIRRAVLKAITDQPAEIGAAYRDRTFGRKLLELHTLLTRGGFEFGYRVYSEALRFAANFEFAGGGEMVALDLQILQKVLPKLHGSRRRLEPTLLSVVWFCFALANPTEQPQPDFEAWIGLESDPIREPELPRSFDKSRRMLRTLRANQFVSFTE